MPTQEKKFISEHGYETYGTAHEERTRREINAKFTIDKADVQAYCADAKADIESTKTAAESYINDVAADYAGAVYLTQEEYDALTPEQKMDSTKSYWIEE